MEQKKWGKELEFEYLTHLRRMGLLVPLQLSYQMETCSKQGLAHRDGCTQASPECSSSVSQPTHPCSFGKLQHLDLCGADPALVSARTDPSKSVGHILQCQENDSINQRSRTTG